MASWSDLEHEDPDFAARVQSLFAVGKHKTIATLRADGSPRISGIEAEFADGELTFGSMDGARKGADLVRDSRFALHSPSVDPPEDNPAGWSGEAKVAGRAVLVGAIDSGDQGDADGAGDAAGTADEGAAEGSGGQLFRAEIDEVVLTKLTDAGDRLQIETWRPGHPVRRIERD